VDRYDPVKHPRGFWRDAFEALALLGLVFKTRPFLLGFSAMLVAVIGGGALGLPSAVGIILGAQGLFWGGHLGLREVDRRLGPLSNLHEQG
jgi:hypothetical protein